MAREFERVDWRQGVQDSDQKREDQIRKSGHLAESASRDDTPIAWNRIRALRGTAIAGS